MERLTRTEMQGLEWLLTATSILADGDKDLHERLSDDDAQALFRVRGELLKIINHLLDDVPPAQLRKVRSTMSDMQMQLVPKMMPRKVSVILSKDEGEALVDAAQHGECAYCTRTDAEARECKLYHVMTAVVPLEDYGGGLLCPYNLATWEDE